MNRREFIQTCTSTISIGSIAAGAGSATKAVAQAVPEDTERYVFLLPTVKFDCLNRHNNRWNAYPGAHLNLLTELSSVMRCKTKLPQDCNDANPIYGADYQFNAVVTFDSIEPLRRYPFLFMTAEGDFQLPAPHKNTFKTYLQDGGFILMDDCIQSPRGDYFYQGSYRLLEELFGRGSVQPIPLNHEVFHNVYDFKDVGLPSFIGDCINHGAQGVFIEDRLAVFLSSTDIHCGWARQFGGYQAAIELGINMIMYAISH